MSLKRWGITTNGEKMNGKTVKELRLYEQYNGYLTQDRSSKLVVQHPTMVDADIFLFTTIVSSQQC
jgi:hypothetical protein